MAKYRKPDVPQIVAPIDHEALARASAALNEVPILQPTVNAAQVAFSQRIGARFGRRRLADTMSKLVTVTSLAELQQIKDSGAYKGYQLMDEVTGEVVTVTTWDSFCVLVEGRSREQVDTHARHCMEHLVYHFRRMIRHCDLRNFDASDDALEIGPAPWFRDIPEVRTAKKPAND
jgi:hypothetical protein